MNRIKELRKKKGMTQQKLALQIGITSKYISFIENNEREPSLKVAMKLSSILETSVNDIFLGKQCTNSTQTTCRDNDFKKKERSEMK